MVSKSRTNINFVSTFLTFLFLLYPRSPSSIPCKFCRLSNGVNIVNADYVEGSFPHTTNIEVILGIFSFGFLEGGTVMVSIDVTPQDAPLFLLMCDEADQYKIASWPAQQACVSIWVNDPPCGLVQPFQDRLRLEAVIDRYDTYSFDILNCQHYDINANIEATMLNPGNNHLPSTLIPAPIMYTIMAIVWGVVFVVWTFSHILYWSRGVWLHRIMSLFPLMKAIFCLFAVHYYHFRERNGFNTGENFGTYWSLYISSQVLFYLILILIAKGYGICRVKMGDDKYYIFALLSFMSMIMAFRYLLITSNVVSLIIALALITFNVSILVYIFLTLTQTQRLLEQNMLSSNIDIQNIRVHYATIKRHRSFVVLKVILAAWLILDTFAFFANLMLFGGTDENWVNLMDNEFLDFILFCSVAYNFRHRTENMFMAHEEVVQSEETSNEEEEETLSNNQGENNVSVEMVTLTPISISTPNESTPSPPNSPVFSEEAPLIEVVERDSPREFSGLILNGSLIHSDNSIENEEEREIELTRTKQKKIVQNQNVY